MPKPLVIVESPAKAKTIAGILGRDYVVESSIGHVRDLPNGAAEIPESHRGKAWARLGVDVDNDFEALYVVPANKQKQVTKLRKLVKEAKELYLATDEDREGEAIAWHLNEVLKPRVPVKRMVFHEITRSAIKHAVENPRAIDQRLVDAQEARRILDRLVGYEISPVLWKRITRGLSAGRVQSVATRMLVERERARMAFRAASYWDVEGRFTADGSEFTADVAALDGKRIASGRDFDASGTLASDEIARLDETAARELVAALDGADFEVRSVEEKPWRRSPSAPFMTSTLQQESLRKLRFSVHKTMRLAQSLYERGFITYMRTDSITLSREAITAARRQATELFGPEFVPAEPRAWQTKAKNAQEAHEAIRPAGEVFRKPDELAAEISPDEHRLYELIWMRTLGSQMADARGQSTSVRLGTRDRRGRDVEFSASGRVIEFPGFLRAYVEGADDAEAALDDQQKILPALAVGDRPKAIGLEPKGHETNPPARYTEASLVKALEEKGVGRPSTYASIIDTIERRGYVFKRGSALVPSWTAFAVTQLLERHFEKLVDYAFTARMEDDLDEIAGGGAKSGPYLKRFYLGNGELGLRDLVADRLEKIDAREVCSVPLAKDASGRAVILRVGKYGPFIERGEDRAGVPEDLPPDELTLEKAEALLAQPSQDRPLGTTTVRQDDGSEVELPVIARNGRYGPYVQLGEIEPGSKEKPKTVSLFRAMSLDTITLDDALRLLSQPRLVGEHEGEPVLAQNGRYGPYLQKGKETRSLESEDLIFSITLEQALAILSQPKQRRGARGAARAPLRELGPDPTSNRPIVVKQGRFGPYVTDGETNASLRRGDSPESITMERALELFEERRERLAETGGVAPRRAARVRRGAAKPNLGVKRVVKAKTPKKPKGKRSSAS